MTPIPSIGRPALPPEGILTNPTVRIEGMCTTGTYGTETSLSQNTESSFSDTLPSLVFSLSPA